MDGAVDMVYNVGILLLYGLTYEQIYHQYTDNLLRSFPCS